MCTTDDIHVCAECLDFLGGGDWGLSCKSADYHDLCYDHTLACGRFKPGREIDLRIIAYDFVKGLYYPVCSMSHGERHSFKLALAKAKEHLSEGGPYYGVYDVNMRYPRLLWNEQIEREYWRKNADPT